MYGGVYTARMVLTSVSIAKTLVQINSAATRGLELIEVIVTFGSTTSTAIEVGIKTVSTAGTGTSITAVPVKPQYAAFGGTCTSNHTAEGTLAVRHPTQFVNYLNGLYYTPVPEARIGIDASQRICIDLPSAPGAAVNIICTVTFGTV